MITHQLTHQCLCVSFWPNQNRNHASATVFIGQMWWFCSLFSSIAMAWCIMNFCHKVIRSMRTITLNLCAECVKQFIRNAQNCEEIKHGSCTMITLQHSHHACAWIFGQNQNRNHASTTVCTGLGLRWLLPLPVTEDTDERKAFCYDWGHKRKIETRAVGDTKKRISEIFRGLRKTLA